MTESGGELVAHEDPVENLASADCSLKLQNALVQDTLARRPAKKRNAKVNIIGVVPFLELPRTHGVFANFVVLGRYLFHLPKRLIVL